jgi:hypothetical protein
MSDKKKLLEEGTIRRFQTLANIKPLNSEYSEVLEEASKKKAAPAGGERHHAGGRGVGGHGRDKMEEKKKHAGDEAVEEAKYSEEESMEEAKYAEEESLEEAGHSYEEGSYGYEEAAMPMAEEEETGGEGGEGMTAEIEDDVEEIAARLSSILSKVGSSKEVDTEEEGGAEAEPMDMGAPEEEEGSMMEAKKKGPHHGKKMEEKKQGRAEEEKEKKKKGVHEGLDEEEALAEELTRRVAARLVAEMRAAKAGAHKPAGKKMKGVSEKAVIGFDGSGTKHHGGVGPAGKPGTGAKDLKPAQHKPKGLAGR